MKRFATLAYDFLHSAALTVWLVGLFLLYYLSMAVWSKEAFGTYINHLSSNNLFRASYLLFLVNAALRIVDRMRRLWPSRPQFLLQLPFLVGILIFLTSSFLSLNTRKILQTQPVGLGDVITIPQSAEQYQIQSVEPALRKRSLRSQGAAVFDYEPGAVLRDPEGRTYRVGAFPPRPVGSTYMHVLTFGVGPGVELRKGNRVVYRGYIALRLTPFGNVDSFDIPSVPYTFFLSIIPNSIIKKGKESASTYDLERPRYHVAVIRDEKTVLQAETESSIAVDEDMILSFYTPSDWVMLEVAHDHFLIWFVCSLGLICIGIILFLVSLWYQGAQMNTRTCIKK